MYMFTLQYHLAILHPTVLDVQSTFLLLLLNVVQILDFRIILKDDVNFAQVQVSLLLIITFDNIKFNINFETRHVPSFGQYSPGFLKFLLSAMSVYVCLCVSSPKSINYINVLVNLYYQLLFKSTMKQFYA